MSHGRLKFLLAFLAAPVKFFASGSLVASDNAVPAGNHAFGNQKKKIDHMQFKIPASSEHVRSIRDPNNERVRIVHAFVNVNDLPQDIPLDPDPRRPKLTGEVPKQITNSLRSNDGKFHLKNRGITISAKHCEFDNKRNCLTLTIPEEDGQFGILDGAHTYECIRRCMTEGRKQLQELQPQTTAQKQQAEDRLVFAAQYVHLEILERIENDLADIAEARNFSVQLKAFTLANYRDKFDWLLQALGRGFSERTIRVSENDLQPVGILDVIQVISAVNPCLFPEEKPAIDAYKNAGKMLQAFIAEGDKHGFQKLAPVCQDIMRLYDYVRLHFKSKYNAPDDLGRRGKFGRTREAQEAKEKRGSRTKAIYYFLDPKGPQQGEDPIDKGLSIPLISGFRVLLEETPKGQFRWQADPMEFFDKYGPKLVRTLMNASDGNDGDPHSVGRDAQVYQQLTSEVRRWYLESKFEKQQQGRLI